jgi:sigma-B regulation protein RsbU (phosphoserine phosphatase)
MSADRSRDASRGAIAIRILLLIASSLLIACVAALFTVSSLRQMDRLFAQAANDQREVAIANLTRLGQLTAQNTAVSVQTAFLDNNYSYLKEAAAGMVRSDPAVRSAQLLDASGHEVAKEGEPVPDATIAKLRAALDAGTTAHLTDPTAGTLLVGTRVESKTDRLGFVVIAYDTRETERRIAAAQAKNQEDSRASSFRFMVQGGLVLLVGILAAVAFGWWLSRPIQRLADAANTLATGDFGARAEVTGPTELRQLGNIFNQMAVALGQSVQQSIEKATIDREMALARDLQLSMMPPSGKTTLGGLELCSWYLPAGACGGDYYAYFDLAKQGALLVIVGDVMGHGMPAAFVTAAVKSACETAIGHAATPPAPTDILHVIHDATTRAAGGKMTMSGLVTRIDLRQRKFHFGGGGHPWPLVVSKKPGGEWEGTLLNVRGSLLGGTPLEAATLEKVLTPGDLIVWYTDGLTQALNTKATEYGARRLTKIVCSCADRPVEEIVAKIREDFDAFVGGQFIEDDITLVVGRV